MRFLVERGAQILGRNVRVGRGEIDIHARVDGANVAVEVKTVIGLDHSVDAIRQLSRKKAETVRRYAAGLVPPAYRVDLVAVTVRRRIVDIHWVPFAA